VKKMLAKRWDSLEDYPIKIKLLLLLLLDFKFNPKAISLWKRRNLVKHCLRYFGCEYLAY
jgi:hypothetical protein